MLHAIQFAFLWSWDSNACAAVAQPSSRYPYTDSWTCDDNVRVAVKAVIPKASVACYVLLNGGSCTVADNM